MQQVEHGLTVKPLSSFLFLCQFSLFKESHFPTSTKMVQQVLFQNAVAMCNQLRVCALLSTFASADAPPPHQLVHGMPMLQLCFLHCQEQAGFPFSLTLNGNDVEELFNSKKILENAVVAIDSGMDSVTLTVKEDLFDKAVLESEVVDPGSDKHCKVVINEVNGNNPDSNSHDVLEYVELKTHCHRRISLQGYKVVVIKGISENEAVITAAINLWNCHTSDNGFFVAGGLQVHSSDINPSSPHFNVSGQFKNPPVLTDFLDDGGESPIGVALLFNKLSGPLRQVALTEENPHLSLSNQYLLTKLEKNLMDLVVYDRNTPTDSCNIFEDLHADFWASIRAQYVLRQVNSDYRKGFTFNRCSVDTPGYLPESFKLGFPSPNRENDCMGPVFF